MARIRLVTALLASLAAGLPAVSQEGRDAAEWSRFRGPNGTGVGTATDLPDRFDRATNVRWRTAVPSGRSSPVLSRDRVFLTATEGEALLVLALDRATGAIAWRRQAPRDRTTTVDPRNDAASPTPAVGEDVVVVFFPDYGLLAYDHAGEERWRLPLGPFDNTYGMAASPILAGDRVVLACDQNRDSFVVAVDVRTGAIAWRTARPYARSGHCTPVLWTPEAGVEKVLLPGSFYLDAYDLDDGRRVWWSGGLSFEMKSVPVISGGVAYVNGYGSPLNQPGAQLTLPAFDAVLEERDADDSETITKGEMPPSRAAGFFEFVDLDHDGALDAAEWTFLQDALASQNGMLAIRLGGEGDHTEDGLLWSYRRSVPQLPSPLVHEGVLYMLNDQGGLLVTLDPETGKVRTRGRLRDAVDNYFASPVAADGKVFFVSETGIVTVLPAGGSFEPLMQCHLDETCYATPALVDGAVLVRTTEHLWCFGADRGRGTGGAAPGSSTRRRTPGPDARPSPTPGPHDR